MVLQWIVGYEDLDVLQLDPAIENTKITGQIAPHFWQHSGSLLDFLNCKIVCFLGDLPNIS